jgi:hypothetical protein
MKLKDKFDTPIMRHDLGRNELEETKEQCAEIADDFAIEVLEFYHNNLFMIPLKDGEAKRILQHIKKEL